MKECCTAYCDIIEPERSASFTGLSHQDTLRKDIIEMTGKLLRIGAVSSFIPLLIAVRVKHADNYKVYFNYLKMCEKFAFRVYRYAEKRSNTGQTTLFKLGYDLFHGILVTERCYENLRGLLLHYAPNEEFEILTDQLGDNWYNWYGIKYLLYEYELYLAKDKPITLNWMYLNKKDTIEHILPQTPSKPYWQEHWTKEQIEEATNDIGNLTLTLDNSVYSNNGFYEKKGDIGTSRCYINSAILMEREVSKYNDWTYEEYLDRRNKMTSWIKKRWYVEDVNTLGIEIEEDVDIDEIDIVSV